MSDHPAGNILYTVGFFDVNWHQRIHLLPYRSFGKFVSFLAAGRDLGVRVDFGHWHRVGMVEGIA
jgi:hypothetical protein